MMRLKEMHQKTFCREGLGMEYDLCTKHKPRTWSGSPTWTWLKVGSFIPGVSAAPEAAKGPHVGDRHLQSSLSVALE